ncbi:hypothetical protein BHQ23_32510 [Mycobacterium gordonae]|nr:hypothetical protein BHQ23_32510 [Mycobacterium gordonae]
MAGAVVMAELQARVVEVFRGRAVLAAPAEAAAQVALVVPAPTAARTRGWPAAPAAPAAWVAPAVRLAWAVPVPPQVLWALRVMAGLVALAAWAARVEPAAQG